MSSEPRLLQPSYDGLRHLQVDRFTPLPDDHPMREIRLLLGDGHRSFIEALAMRLDTEYDSATLVVPVGTCPRAAMQKGAPCT